MSLHYLGKTRDAILLCNDFYLCLYYHDVYWRDGSSQWLGAGLDQPGCSTLSPVSTGQCAILVSRPINEHLYALNIRLSQARAATEDFILASSAVRLQNQR